MFDPAEVMTIGEVAARTGIRSSALRYYESEGVLPAPQRVSGQRRYDAGIVKQVSFIQAAQKVGFSLDEIKSLQDSQNTEPPYAERLQELARRKLVKAEALIDYAQAMKATLEAGLNCRCESAADCTLFAKDI